MHALLLGSLVVAGALPALSSPFKGVEERGECNRNNMIRCFDPTGTKPSDIAARASATAYCSSYISIPVVTSTIDTTTPVTFTTTTTTTVDSTTIVILQTETTTTTTTTADPLVGKRTPVATVDPPNCLATTYSTSQVSAACVCLSVTPSTTFVTATAATSTDVITSTVHETATTTTTDISVETSVITEDPPCPDSADDVLTFVSDTEIKHFCYYDGVAIATPNFTDHHTATLEECAAICAGDDACVAADYEPATSGLCQTLTTEGTFAFGAQYNLVVRSTQAQPPVGN